MKRAPGQETITVDRKGLGKKLSEQEDGQESEQRLSASAINQKLEQNDEQERTGDKDDEVGSRRKRN